ncbi:MAG TPA: SDR family NAD(P)-dependent oxidoreductase [Bryobacteraceae bacterium]|nr:SDR family NAD(P)-dependent oxidoreductase [Bryobacteraceae bacterium]
MQFDFTGKTAVVTGGANGIGLATARLLAGSRADVWVFDVEHERPLEKAAGFGAHGTVADVRSRDSLEAAFAQAGDDLDIVVACAGVVSEASLADTNPADWERVIAINLTGAFHTVQVAAQRMIKRGKGSIVLVASTNSFDGERNLVAYNASKAGLLGLLHTAANELGPHQVRINAVSPGLIRTRLTQELFTDPRATREYFRHIPLGRSGDPTEVARAIAFLASDAASFITGTALFVDGGQMCAKYGTWNEERADFFGDRWWLK